LLEAVYRMALGSAYGFEGRAHLGRGALVVIALLCSFGAIGGTSREDECAECRESVQAEYRYVDGYQEELIEICAETAGSWGEDGVPEETIRRTVVG
jgi:hypothetical protein